MDDRDGFAAWAGFGRMLELPLRGLRELTEVRRTLAHVERQLVLSARANRSSWREIGEALELSRQAAYSRHRLSVRSTDGDSPRSSA